MKITNNIIPNDSTVATFDESTLLLTVTCKDGYIFDSAPTYEFMDENYVPYDGELTLSKDKKSATATLDTNPANNFILNGSTSETEPTPKVTVEQNLTNCTGDIPQSYDVEGNVNVTLHANTGTIFSNCYIEYIDVNFGTISQFNGTISDDKKTATINWQIPKDVTEITVVGTCVAEEPIGKNYGAINVYVVTLQNLIDFSKVRFTSATYSDFMYYDLGSYINRIKRIFTKVETGISDVIKCASYNTKIAAYQPKEDVITLDFGDVTLPLHNNDITDYECDIQLFIPFVGFVSISNDYVGKTINLQVDIDVITGDGLYRLTCDDIQFQTGVCTPSTDVLYKTADYNLSLIGGDKWNENVFMGLEPYFILKWHESKNANGRNNDFKRGLISSFTGFNSFDDITPISTENMLANEQQTIYNALQSGVYID